MAADTAGYRYRRQRSTEVSRTSGERGPHGQMANKRQKPRQLHRLPETGRVSNDAEHPVFRPRRAKTSGIAQDAGKKKKPTRGVLVGFPGLLEPIGSRPTIAVLR